MQNVLTWRGYYGKCWTGTRTRSYGHYSYSLSEVQPCRSERPSWTGKVRIIYNVDLNLDQPLFFLAGVPGLRITLCADEIVVVHIDPRTGRLNLRDTGNLATAKRGPRFLNVSDQLNENPAMLFPELHKLRLALITELVEHKANYLGLQFYRTRNFSREGDFFSRTSPLILTQGWCRTFQAWTRRQGDDVCPAFEFPKPLSRSCRHG